MPMGMMNEWGGATKDSAVVPCLRLKGGKAFQFVFWARCQNERGNAMRPGQGYRTCFRVLRIGANDASGDEGRGGG